MRFLRSRSDNRKSKIQNRKWARTVTIIVALTVWGIRAEAQQPAKVPRIGYLAATSPSATVARIEAFRQGLRELGYVEEKTLSLSGDMRRENSITSPRSRLSCASQGRHHRRDWSCTNPHRQGSNFYDSHCDDVRSRSCWEWFRRQPCASGREHYWTINSFPGAERKTIGAFEGDCD